MIRDTEGTELANYDLRTTSVIARTTNSEKWLPGHKIIEISEDVSRTGVTCVRNRPINVTPWTETERKRGRFPNDPLIPLVPLFISVLLIFQP